MPQKVAVVCEARADFETAMALAERVLCDAGDWVREVLDHCSLWLGPEAGTTFLTWTNAARLAREREISSHGKFGGESGALDARAGRRALLALERLLPDLDAALLIRDDDRETARRRGLEQARDASARPDRVVIGLAHPKRECWVLAGFQPGDDRETALLADVRQEVGFDPRLSAERLTAKHDHDKLSAKRVVAALTGDDREREARCWTETPLATLQDHGANSGLTDYLDEVQRILVPVVTRTT